MHNLESLKWRKEFRGIINRGHQFSIRRARWLCRNLSKRFRVGFDTLTPCHISHLSLSLAENIGLLIRRVTKLHVGSNPTRCTNFQHRMVGEPRCFGISGLSNKIPSSIRFTFETVYLRGVKIPETGHVM